MRNILSIVAVALLVVPLRGGDGPAEARAKVIAPYIDDLTFVVAHIDVSRIDFDVVSKYLDKDNVETIKAVATLAKTTFLRAGGRDVYVVLHWGRPHEDALLVTPLAKNADSAALVTLVRQIEGFDAELRDDVLLAGTKNVLDRLRKSRPQPVPDLAKALAAVGDGTAEVVFLPPFPLKRAFVENFPVLPKELGGGNSATLDFLWAAARIDAGEKLAAKVVVQAPSAKDAGVIAKVVDRALALAGKDPALKRSVPDIAKVTAMLTPKVQGDRLTLALNDVELTTALLPLVAKRREAASRAQSMNNLKQIALAMYNFHDVNNGFPAAATFDAQGKSLLSWRVHILPYIEEDALYRSFHLNEPWDSEHNKKLIARMPRVYMSSTMKNSQEGKTTYLAPVGPKTMFGGKKGMRVTDITDGTSNTIMVVEADASRAVYWTQPEDFKIDANNPLAGLIPAGAQGFNAAFADGSVHFLPATINADTLRALFTANGGEPVQLP